MISFFKFRHAVSKLVIVLISTLLLSELASRAYFTVSTGTPFFKMDQLIFHYYPELKEVKESLSKDTSDIKVIILGGSVVDESIYCSLGDGISKKVKAHFSDKFTMSVYSLGKAGHTTFDSRIKMQELSKLNFDFVVVYHGINDSRANNIPDKYFDEDYKHFKFYREVSLCVESAYKKWFTSPFALAYILNNLSIQYSNQPLVPPFFQIEGDSVMNTQYWDNGSEIKTAKTFERNLNIMNQLVQDKGDMVLLTYAYYHPKDYSLQRFNNKLLDYSEQKWPTEIYGRPDNVVKAIETHNQVSRQFASCHDVIFIDFEPMVPRNKLFFHDICHLTPAGCQLMENEIANSIALRIKDR